MIDFVLTDKNPKNPADPRATAPTLKIPAINEAMHEPTKAQKNGNLNFKLTPKIAGSVIPNNAETPADEAKPFVFLSFVKVIKAKVAAPCATLAIEATIKIKSPTPW